MTKLVGWQAAAALFALAVGACAPAGADSSGLRPAAWTSVAGFQVGYDDGGVRLRTDRAGEVALRWTGLGRRAGPEFLLAPVVGAGALSFDGATASYTRPEGRQWYVHLPHGLEQGFDIERRPAGDGALALRVGFEGMKPIVSADGRAVALLGPDGAAALHYRGLFALDADGVSLASTIAPCGGEVCLVIDDAGARYPIVIDPVLTEDAKLVASDASADDWFGRAVAIDGDTAAVGAPHRIEGLYLSGAAYVFTSSGGAWSEQARLTPSDAPGNDFGQRLALAGDTLLVAAPGDFGHGQESGAVYVFTRAGGAWSERAKLSAGDGEAFDRFGNAVALDGDTALVGAPGDDDGGSDSGSAYVLTGSADSWSAQAKLAAADAAAGDGFAVNVALDGDTALLGAPTDDDGGPESGSAYVFVRSGQAWSQQAKLVAGDAAPDDRFGVGVAVHGDTALVGAPNAGGGGAVYVFVRTAGSWSEQAKLVAAGGGDADSFGARIALGAGRALVGAWRSDAAGPMSGAAYVFTAGGGSWSQELELHASDATGAEFFGYEVALDDGAALVGAWGDDDSAGSAYAFALPSAPGAPCANAEQCASGFCVDGLCCDGACGGGADDCQACNLSGQEGTCSALAAGTVCRPGSGDLCDPDELCDGSSPSCPDDVVEPAGMLCRGAADACDAEETCTGAPLASCPADEPSMACSTPPAEAESPAGCGCRFTTEPRGGWLLAIYAALAALVAARSRRTWG